MFYRKTLINHNKSEVKHNIVSCSIMSKKAIRQNITTLNTK